MPEGPLTTQYIGGIVADQLSKMAATMIGSITLSNLSYLMLRHQKWPTGYYVMQLSTVNTSYLSHRLQW